MKPNIETLPCFDQAAKVICTNEVNQYLEWKMALEDRFIKMFLVPTHAQRGRYELQET